MCDGGSDRSSAESYAESYAEALLNELDVDAADEKRGKRTVTAHTHAARAPCAHRASAACVAASGDAEA